MEEDLKRRLDAQDAMLARIATSSEKTRKYFLWTLIATVAVVVLPLIGLLIVIPQFLSSYTSALSGF